MKGVCDQRRRTYPPPEFGSDETQQRARRGRSAKRELGRPSVPHPRHGPVAGVSVHGVRLRSRPAEGERRRPGHPQEARQEVGSPVEEAGDRQVLERM